MSSDDIIGSDATLNSDQQRTFVAILGMIIPASGDGRFPSAADMDVLGYIAKTDPQLLDTVRTELDRLNAVSEDLYGVVFGDAGETHRQGLLDEKRGAEPHFLGGSGPTDRDPLLPRRSSHGSDRHGSKTALSQRL